VQIESDENIIQLLGNPKTVENGFKLLMKVHQEKLYWLIRRMVGDHDDANDVMQNTMIKVFRNIQNFKGDSKLSTWMTRIATNESITFINNRKPNHSIQSTSIGESLVQLKSDVYVDGDETELLLQAAIETLPDKQRQVFNLRYFDEMPYEEMSNILETSVGALKASFHHAVKKIESYIKEKEL
jgi:RNA polymerase sigma-70 factor, ECF subfamily